MNFWLKESPKNERGLHKVLIFACFFAKLSDFINRNADYESYCHIRQGTAQNEINLHKQAVNNKADKPDDKILNIKRFFGAVFL